MSTAKFDTLSNLAGTQSVPVATVAQGSAKAWVNFNGTGTVAIRASFNVTSITDNATGQYTINFTTSLPDANYAVSGSSTGATSSGLSVQVAATGGAGTAPNLQTVNAVSIFVGNTSTTVDANVVSAAVFR
jgi:hypothetical protein